MSDSLIHPLDPLSAAEVSAAVAAVKSTFSDNATLSALRFCETVLLEPPKEDVLLANAHFFPPFISSVGVTGSSSHGSSSPVLPPRKVRVVVYNKLTNETTDWTVQVLQRDRETTSQVLSGELIPGVQPAMDAMEYVECEATIKAFPPFQEAMKKRGVVDMDLVMVDPWCTGYFSEKHNPDRRLASPIVYLRTASSSAAVDNGYARPVEGLKILVDMQRMRILEFEDLDVVPIPPPDPLRNYTEASVRGGVDRPDVKPLHIVQPLGPSFRVQGHYVEWQKWSFRVGFTPKEGLVLHTVCYDDDSLGRRSIAHRLSFCEMVVPYGDPHDPHYRKNAFDAGEDGLGKNAHSLSLGCDCVGEVHYFDAWLSNFVGGVEAIERAICLHEEDSGMLWKHMDWRTGHTQMRRSRRLSVSFICTVANYEYAFFWHLYQDGKIEGEVKLTGILSVGALRPGETRKYGTMIGPQLYAPIHQHFFVARLDMAVDSSPGCEGNQVAEVNVVTEAPGPHNPHNNSFFGEETVLRTESEGGRDCNPASARYWLVRNVHKKNRTGAPTAYKLVPGSNCLPFSRPDAMFLRRAPFLMHNLWVTKYARDENFPGGDYPNQNPKIGDGLLMWIKKDRNIDGADVVLWYVFGLTHVVRPEDWPVMPVEHLGFVLQPEGFFNSSPAIDVPPSEPVCHVAGSHMNVGVAKL